MNQDETIAFAKKYLEDLLAFFEVNIEVQASLDGDVLELDVPSTENNSILIGRSAETLRNIQHIISSVLRNNNAFTSRVNVDIADYKKQRAEKIAENAGSSLGKLKKATMGITQITAPNSTEEYSYGGTFNTSSKDKEASITIKLEYQVD